MRQERRFIRVRPSGNLSRTGKIIVDSKSPVIECGIVDYSAGGACLQVAPGTLLPKRFELLYSGTKKKCRVVWTNGIRLGVAF
ncbi:PilZ domain-containing protein [Bradyrhizobium sp. G127]|uniref:PilZ domain-containing protein n=1 Tax=Bradyrhizobium sp. G127 TaxID=2904800 RepID=UPI001F3C57B2|nr:PilZ domain-containing protein [Bradyrhizobium sp. G127]MCF2524323.1 PilZ domain-containing protein [Bradyrhizobium sp. G127]